MMHYKLSNKESLHIVISVENGEEIAKNTANAKVGVLGGISILGTRGIVKPVSATAYIDSIATEISVASKNSEVVVFTLGNSAQDRALELYESVSVVEIGNFVYDALMLLEGYHFSKVVFITSVAKMTKVAQGYKNTHNRFGSIDFTQVKEMVESLGSSMQDDVVTLKAVLESLDASTQRVFIEQITQKAMMQIVEWIESKAEVTETLEVLTLPSEIKKEYRW
jgi:cobalt-precorrin-5B (C1)-methyltransferase